MTLFRILMAVAMVVALNAASAHAQCQRGSQSGGRGQQPSSGLQQSGVNPIMQMQQAAQQQQAQQALMQQQLALQQLQLRQQLAREQARQAQLDRKRETARQRRAAVVARREAVRQDNLRQLAITQGSYPASLNSLSKN